MDWFHPAEVGTLNKILDLATCVLNVHNFIVKYRNGSSVEDLHGLYLEAFCDGLEAALAPYKAMLASMEGLILKAGGHTQLTNIQHQIMGFQPVLEALNSLVDKVVFQKPHGCMILDVVRRSAVDGVGDVKDALNDVLFECHKVFYKQLLAWILKGNLHDPFQEFIIEEVEGETSSATSLVSSEDSRLPTQHCASSRWRLKVEKIPGHISFSVAEKIFFIGESIQLFESDYVVGRKIESQKDVLKDQENQLYNELVSYSLRRLRKATLICELVIT